MNNVTFDNKVLLEQIRCIESAQALPDEPVNSDIKGSSFDARLLHRAQQLAQLNQLDEATSHAASIVGVSKIAALLVALVLGAGATLTAVAGGSTINIYWLLLLLVGFNFLSMLLWLVGISTRMESLISGSLSKATAWLPSLLSKRESNTGRADKAWLDCQFAGDVGKWHASLITQQLWLAYLSAGLVTLIIVLIARQFDFVWGTTLLSDASFVQLTSTLSKPLEALGFATPSPAQVLETRIGSGYDLNAEHRYNWGQFLIGMLLVGGVLPRIILWLCSKLLLSRARQNFELDYYLPYYVQLRQQLLPLHGKSHIVDADSESTQGNLNDFKSAARSTIDSHAPHTAHWVGLELDSTVSWPPALIDSQRIIGSITDRATLQCALEKLREIDCNELIIAVTANRTPDRGLKRSIAALSAEASSTWLMLLQSTNGEPVTETRLAAWFRLAQACNIAAQNVVTQQQEAR